MTFKLTILACRTGSPIASALNQTSQHLQIYNTNILIDCGEGTQHQMIKFGLSYQKIDLILISHLHADHYSGLIPLLNTMNSNDRDKELIIIGPPELKKLLDIHFKLTQIKLKYPIRFIKTSTNKNRWIFENNQLKIKSLPLEHRIPSTGFLFIEKKGERNILKNKIKDLDIPYKAFRILKSGENYAMENGETLDYKNLTTPAPKPRSYAFVSDTAYHEKLIKSLKKIDLLYHETTFDKDFEEKAEISKHSTSYQAATIALKAEVKQLIIGHISTRYFNPEIILDECISIFPYTILAHEGLEIEITKNKKA